MASNVVQTTDQVRQDFQHSATVDGLMKNVYLPALNNTTFHATPLMDMFGDFGGKLDFASNKIIKGFKYQGAGGFGAISEGGDFVKGRRQKGFQGEERIRYLNSYVSLTGPAAKTVIAGEGAYVDAMSSAIEDTLKLAKMNMERIVGGSGTGELCRFLDGGSTEAAMVTGEFINTSGAASATAVALTGTAGGAYTFVQWLQDGMRVHLIKSSEFDGTIAATDMVEDSSNAAAVFEVGNVDYTAVTFSLKLVSSDNVDIQSEMASTTVVLVLEGAYGEIEAAGGVTSNQCLEPNGLLNLIDDGATYSTIWGKTRSTYPRSLKSTVIAAASAELDEELLMGWILDLVNVKQTVPNVLVTDPKSRLKYFTNRKEDRRFDTQEISGAFGLKSIGVTIDQYTLMVQSLSSLPLGFLLMITSGDFSFVNASDGFQWKTDNGNTWRNFENKDGIFATACSYTNFVCENPKDQFKATGLSY